MNRSGLRINVPLMFTVLVVIAINYLTQPAWILPGDSVTTRFETANIVGHGRFGIDADQVAGERGQYFFENSETGRWYPKYGVLNSLIYIPALALEHVLTAGDKISPLLGLVILNLHNLVLTAVCAGLLYMIAGFFTARGRVRSLFTLACIYTTFLWFYTRAQSFEIHQTVLMLAAVWCGLHGGNRIATGRNPTGWIAGSGAFLGLLILAKAVYVIAMPVFAAYFVVCLLEKTGSVRDTMPKLVRVLAAFAVPWLVFFTILLAANTIRFGSPLNLGYSQWEREASPMSGNPLIGIQGYLFDSKFSIFAAFPPLLIALFYWRAFLRRHRAASFLFIGLFTVLMVVNSFFVNWAGHWSYGPRYLVPVLPLVSLPFLLLLESVTTRAGIRRHRLAGASAACLLTLSAVNQLAVNRFMFFFHYQLEFTAFAEAPHPGMITYLRERPVGIIALDFSRWIRDRSRFEPLERASVLMTPEQRARTEALLLVIGGTNFLFLSDQWWKPAESEPTRQ